MSAVKRAVDPRVNSVHDLVRKEALAAGIALAVVCLVSALLDAPLQGPADVGGLAASDLKAPWILVGIQELLKYLPALTAGVLLPLAAVLLIGAIPFLSDRRGLRPIVFFGTTLTFVLLTIRGYLS